MKWSDVIEKVLHENKGVASLHILYERAAQYRRLPTGDWRKTLRGVLYREVKRGRFAKVGLGVYALPSLTAPQPSAYTYALRGQSVEEYFHSLKGDLHSTIEGMLLEIGNFLEYHTYTADTNRYFDNKPLRDLCTLHQIPDFTYPDMKKRVARCDVIWFTRSSHPFPKYVFEVEITTDFTNSMLKMFELKDFDVRLVLVASERRSALFHQRLSQEPFASVRSKFHFRSFEMVGKFYFNCVEHYELKSTFLP
ncbi:MAG: hypothetical protein NZ951_02625 [Dehalococcoidia bacterium]|nr:hypothetical protein [Dehalococcoidia bacterium]MDW8119855.1 hypothetical protein [Chloroflexota bacterium]